MLRWGGPLTEPLTPAKCDLRDFAFMPLDVARLRDSELASNETPQACWAAVQLWAASWHQVPAASIPNDDKWMAQQCGYGRVVKEWLAVKPGALRGWIECSDGRLYHPVVAEKAGEAWQAKLAQRWRSECSRVKKHNQRHGTSISPPPYEQWLSLGCPQGQPLFVPGDTPACPKEVPRETHSKGEGEGQGQGQIRERASEAIASAAVGVSAEKPKLVDPDEIIFGYGVPMLASAGSTDKHARSFLAGLRKGHGDALLIDALRSCAKAKPLQPLEWLAAALPPKGSGRHVGFGTKNYREGVTADGSL